MLTCIESDVVELYRGTAIVNTDMLYLVPAHSSSVLSMFNLSLFADIQLSMSVMQHSSLPVAAAVSFMLSLQHCVVYAWVCSILDKLPSAGSQCQVRSILPVDMIYTDIVGLIQFKRKVRTGYAKFR